MSQSDISRVANALKPLRLEQEVTPELTAGIQAWGSSVLSKLGSDVGFDLRNPMVQDYLDAWQEQRIVGITQTTREDLTAIMQDAVKEGVGIDEMRRRMRGFFEEAADYRAERIARTEVVSSSNAANLAAYQISGLVEGKEWLAVQDTQTRESHADLDGTRIGITEEFSTPNGTAPGPGLFGVPGEDVNCRCTLMPVVDTSKAGPQGEERALVWRAYVDSLGEWERNIQDASASVFALWLGDAIRALGD